MAQNVNRRTVWKIKRRWERFGDEALRDHKPGRLYEPLNTKFYQLVVDMWKKNKCGARKLHVIMTKKGFSVSLRKISQVMIREGFQKPFLKRRKPRKYKRYEWPISNYMWHTDWHVMKSEKLKGKEFISFIDDSSRKIMSYGVFDNQTTRNSLVILYAEIAEHCVIPFELNSDRGTQFIANKFDKDGEANHEFQQAIEELGILFIPSRARHPQTNGKLEKFHHILDSEFDERFEDLPSFIKWYNSERLSEAIDYLTPDEAYKKRL